MKNEYVQTVLDLVVEYGQTKHNRKRKEILANIERLIKNETTDREERTETSSATIEGPSSAGFDEGCE